MRTTIDFLDDAKIKLGDISDYRMAKILGINQSSMSQYRTKKRTLDDYAASQIAKILEIDEMIIISAANAEREKTEERRNFWASKYKALGGVAASLILGLSLTVMTPLPSEARTTTGIESHKCILC